MSQKELAKKLNISSGTIGMYESGKRTPPLSRAIEIAKLFNVPVESISFVSSKSVLLGDSMASEVEVALSDVQKEKCLICDIPSENLIMELKRRGYKVFKEV